MEYMVEISITQTLSMILGSTQWVIPSLGKLFWTTVVSTLLKTLILKLYQTICDHGKNGVVRHIICLCVKNINLLKMKLCDVLASF